MPAAATAQVRHRLRVEQAGDGLITGKQAGQGDHHDDGETGKILRTPVAIGVAPGRRAAGQSEGDEKRDGGQGVGDVVEGVPQQRDRPGEDGDDGLDDGRHPQPDKADYEGAAARAVRLQGVVDLVGRVVRVTTEKLRHGVPQALGQPVVVRLVVVLMVVVLMVVCPVPVGSFHVRGLTVEEVTHDGGLLCGEVRG